MIPMIVDFIKDGNGSDSDGMESPCTQNRKPKSKSYKEKKRRQKKAWMILSLNKALKITISKPALNSQIIVVSGLVDEP